MRLVIVIAVLFAAWLLPTATATASASCGGWFAYNRDGEAARVSRVVPRGTMNCASSRYVVNKWLKRSYQRQSRNRLPGRFYDGYVTWYCKRVWRYQWRCREHETDTWFTFRAIYYG